VLLFPCVCTGPLRNTFPVFLFNDQLCLDRSAPHTTHHTTPYTALHRTVPHHTTPHHTTPKHNTSNHTTTHLNTPHTIYHTKSHHTTPHSAERESHVSTTNKPGTVQLLNGPYCNCSSF